MESAELLLVGYVPLCRYGFALPCYGERPRANALHVASCFVPGDHAGSVSGFEAYAAAGVEWLPEAEHRRVRVGDPWLDVFLWTEGAGAGTAAELLTRLRPSSVELTAQVPISWLDLVLAGGDEGAVGLAEAARSHVQRRHGADMAARWRGDLIRDQARLVLRRQLAASGLSGPIAAAVRHTEVAEGEAGLTLIMPDALAAALDSAGATDELAERIGRLAERIGTGPPLTSATGPDVGEDRDGVARSRGRANASAGRSLPSSDDGGDETFVRDDRLGSTDGAALRILVVVWGTRSRAVARHVLAPDWVPVGGDGALARDWVVRRGGEVRSDPEATASVIDVIADGKLPSSFEDYDAVAWLLDDGEVLNGNQDGVVMRLEREGGPARRAVHLLAPALPLHEPSRVLAEFAATGSLPFGADCVVDTSLARSPFWTGNPWRAIDRRMADVVVGSALVCAVDERVRADLLRRRRATRSGSTGTGRLRLMSCATERVADGRTPGGLGLVSETTVRGIAKRPDRGEVYEFDVVPLRKSATKVRRGWIALSKPEPDFELFADAAIKEARRLERGSAGPVDDRDDVGEPPRLDRAGVPGAVEGTLRSARWAAAFESDSRRTAVVTAEAPTLKTLRAATGAGVSVVRYTDRETLLELLHPGAGEQGPRLPREIRLPALERLQGNRGLATRGVDPRDVIRLPRDRAEWGLSDAASSAVMDLARGYVSRVGIEAIESIEEIALPLDAAADLVAGDGPVVRELRKALSLDRRRGPAYSLKRPSDLRVAWAEPAFGERRFVVEDGRFPIEIMRLPRGTVPAQRMFIVDGDSAVPLLLGSRIFAVWARATTSRSTSWLSRFSVGGTFETLPIPRGLAVRRDDEGRVGLVLESRDSDLAELAAWLGNERDGGTRWHAGYTERDRLADAPIWRDADAALLAAIELPADATDIDVLERIVALNREGRDPERPVKRA